LPVRVACVADRDIPPDEAKSLGVGKTLGDWKPEEVEQHLAALRADDGGSVVTKVSPRWTFEYDLALTDIRPYLHLAISLAKRARKPGRALPAGDEAARVVRGAVSEYAGWCRECDTREALACRVYEPLLRRAASKATAAHCLAHLLSNLRNGQGWDAARWRRVIPEYIVEAIDHATGVSGAAGAS
jgi:putative ATP-dependent endonuclease of OLD family